MSIPSTGAASGAALPADVGAAADAAAGSTTSTPEATVVRGTSPGRPIIDLPEAAGPRHALGEALSNDRRGVVSENDAKTIIAAALKGIGEASDPRLVFEGSKRVIAAARLMLGHDVDARKILDGYEAAGEAAMDARLSELAGGAPVLPTAARAALLGMLGDYDLAGAPVTISDVAADDPGAFTFRFEGADGRSGTGFALSYNGEWFFAPTRVERADLDKVTSGMQAWFDAGFAGDMRDWGASEREIDEARAALAPSRMLFPGESDPYGYTSLYAMTFQLENETGSDHGIYAGYDPATGAVDGYAFN